jgi:hypothetical protein
MKIAICTPHYGDVTPQYAFSLANMVLFTARTQFTFNEQVTAPEIKIMMQSSSLVPEARTLLADRAIAWGANYLLWIDADHSFPDDALVRLLSLNKDVVGANYVRRGRPTSPTARDGAGEPVWTTEELAKANSIQEVADIGLGFCLISMPVLHILKEMGHPLFMLPMSPDGKFFGEDYYFCELVRNAGYLIHVDHALSWHVGHVARSELFNRHAVEDKAAYESGRR